jgi:hypothetical protein
MRNAERFYYGSLKVGRITGRERGINTKTEGEPRKKTQKTARPS